MNNLSWLLYLAEVCRSTDITLNIVFWLGIVYSAGLLIALMALKIVESGGDDSAKEASLHLSKQAKWMLVPVIALALDIAVPSDTTIYLIAASEIGEAASVPEEMSDLYQSLKTIITEAARSAVE